jgi:HlyD family secretion protein
MSKTIIWIIAVVVILGLATVLIFKPFQRDKESYQFETAKIEKGAISNTVTATGTLEAITTVEVGTQVSGVIENLYVDFNSNVKKGQLLAELDKTPLLAQLEQTKATVDEAEAELEFQTANYNRLMSLWEKDLIAQTDIDQASYNFKRATSSLSSARSVYNKNKINLDYATIRSPIDGVVLERAVDQGQTVAASFNTPTLFTIANDLTQMQVESDVDEADIGMVRFGERVEFTVDAYPDDRFSGMVSEVRLLPVITNNVVTYTVIIDAPNPDKKLMPGMTASIIIFIEEKGDALVLPGKALRFRPDMEYMMAMFEKMFGDSPPPGMPAMGGGQGMPMPGQGMPGVGIPGMMPFGPSDGDSNVAMIWVKDSVMTMKMVMIEKGIDNGSEVEVISGLEEGDEVIISMSRSTGRKEEETTATRSPFMPSPPGR